VVQFEFELHYVRTLPTPTWGKFSISCWNAQCFATIPSENEGAIDAKEIVANEIALHRSCAARCVGVPPDF